MVNMVDIVIEHIGVPSLIGTVNAIRQIDGTKSSDEICQTIINSVGENLKNTLLLYKPTITIIHIDGREYFLDQDYIRMCQPFTTNDHNDKNIKLTVVWSSSQNTQPTQSKGDASRQTDDQKQTADEYDTELIDFGAKLLASIKDTHSQSDLDSIEKNELDPYINGSNQQGRIDQTEKANEPSDKFTKIFSSCSPSCSLNEEKHSGSMTYPDVQVSNLVNGDDNTTTLNQSPVAPKRPNQSKDNTSPKKRKTCVNKQNLLSSVSPKKMIFVLMSTDEKVTIIKDDYVASNVPVISKFNWDKMIHFKYNINPASRERYLTDSKKVPCIQRKKPDNIQCKDSMLPVLQFPSSDQSEPAAGRSVRMGLACVKEYRTEEGEETEFCLVGYKQFKYYPDEKEEILPMSVIYPDGENTTAEQLIFKIPKDSNEMNEYILKAHPFKVKDQFHNEIGPAFFRITAEYIRAAQEKEFKFGELGSAHRYALYLFKYDEQSKQYTPDFESLVLSDYIFKEKEEE